ncbi:MAG TPA: protein kinase, partial [Polyangiaceae bacterium]
MQDDSQRSLPDRASAPLMDSEPFDSDGQLEALIQRVAYAPSVAPQALLAWKSPASLIGVTVAHFRIERLLGVGGLGIVYAARDLTLDRVVALKILTPPTDGDTTSRERVLHEARAAVRVNDPSVASIHEVGEDDGLAFIAMEYVEGETLQARLERGPLPWPIAVGLAVQLARGLAKAHAHGVVHRDLKPENLILGLDSKLKILDFGVAAERGTKTPEAGTPVYMAPEQARAEVADPRVDIYAFGVVLLECITGSVPLLPPPLFFVAARVQMEARGCPVALRSVIERCIEENPAARFDDGASLARAIARVARVDRARQRGWKVAASVVLALAAGICGLWIGARRRHTSIEADRVAAEEHGRLRRLTANVAERPILGSTLSPDGARLAYSDSAGLRITRIGTSEVTQVRFASGQSPQIVRWFGDGARLAVVVAVPGQDERDLRIVDIATGDFSSLGTGNFTALALSPDGRRVGYAEDDAVGWLAADKPAERHFLVRKDAGCFIGDIAWSPKGDRLAYASLCFDSLAATTLETIGLDGASPTVVMNEPRLFNDMARGGVAWLPRGDLLFSLAEWLPSEPGSNLWVLPIDEVTGKPKGERRQVTHWTGVAVSSLSIDAAGDRATFVRYDVQTDVFLGELTANKELVRPPVRLTLKERNERSPTWDKAGRGVYYSSDESGNFDLFYQDLEEGHPPVPVVATHAWETEPVLSPDGAQLLYWQIFPVDPGGATSA